MSIEALNWALWQDQIADPVARHVLLVLANYAQEDGRNAFCSVETMCCATRLGERTIRRKLDELEAQGAIRKGNQAVAAAYIDRADRRPTVFDLAIGPVPTKREAVLRRREKKRGATVTPRATRGAADDAAGCRLVHDGVPFTTERGATAAPEPSITHQLNHLVTGDARDACLKPETFELPHWVDAKAWAAYDRMRVRIRKPMTDDARRLAVRKLEQLHVEGHDPVAVLEQSVLHGWQGLFEVKKVPSGWHGARAAPRRDSKHNLAGLDYHEGIGPNGEFL